MTSRSLKKASVAGLSLWLAGCATTPGQPNGMPQAFNNAFNNPDPCAHNARNAGMVLGGIAGTLIGAKLGDKKAGAMIAGAVVGTAVGGLVGANIDRRRCELAGVAREYKLQMSFAAVASDGRVITDTELGRGADADTVKKNAIGNVVSLQDDNPEGGHFESNSDVLTARAERYFSAIADIYNQEKAAQAIADPAERRKNLADGAQRRLLLVGHTDDTGQSRLNADLSERRARAVAQYLERRGIPREQMYYQGGGEVYPVADNASPAGRAQNRRVEIVEVSNPANLSRYLEARRPNYQFYRSVPNATGAGAAEQPTVAARAEPARAAAKPKATPARRTEPATPAATAAVPNAAPNRAPNAAPASAPASSPASAPARSGQLAQAPAAPAATPLANAGASAKTRPSAAAATPSASPATPAAPAVAAKPAGAAPGAIAPTVGRPLDFGGRALAERQGVAASIGKLDRQRPLFSLISNAYADDVALLADCSQDRPRVSGAVKALRDGATYKVAEHVPGLYGKSWTDRVNGHQVVINKVAVLASEASLAQFPELKVYANYNPADQRNPKPDVSIRPEVNTYLAEGGILYRIFTNGAAGMQCVDILYHRNGGAAAKGGNIVYARDNRLYISDFKPVIAN